MERLGSSNTDVIDLAGVSDKLDLLLPLTANIDLLLLLLLAEGSTEMRCFLLFFHTSF